MSMTKIDREIWQRLPTSLHIATRYAEELDADSMRYADSMRELASNYSAFFMGDSQSMGLPAINSAASYYAWRIKASLRVHPRGSLTLVY